MKHDYESALKAEISWLGALEGEAKEHALTVIKALKLAAKVTGDISDGMHDIGITISERDGYRINEWACPSEIFKSMIEQAQREIEG